MNLSFGDCVFDSETRELRRAGVPIPLTPKAFELLAVLVERQPRAVSKAEIRDRLWPRTFVSDVNLAGLAFEVRQAIGDDARRPRHLRTVRGFGYALRGASARGGAGEMPSCGRLVLSNREITLRDGEYVLGRGEGVTVVLDAARISRRHARLSVIGSRVVLEDLGSRNGTFHAGVRIEGPVTLKDGDRIRIGNESIVFRAADRNASTATGRRESE